MFVGGLLARGNIEHLELDNLEANLSVGSKRYLLAKLIAQPNLREKIWEAQDRDMKVI